jgi:hypothetical protein
MKTMQVRNTDAYKKNWTKTIQLNQPTLKLSDALMFTAAMTGIRKANGDTTGGTIS